MTRLDAWRFGALPVEFMADDAPHLGSKPANAALFASQLKPAIQAASGEVLVWAIRDDASQAQITDQFKANAEDYVRRYGASDHFEHLFQRAFAAAKVDLPEQPLILDLGSGSGVNSIVPCRRLFPNARMVATDLSAELLAMLADYLQDSGASEQVICVKMDAMSDHVRPGAFDLVTGASILHHLDDPEQGIAAAGRALKPGGYAIFFEPFHGWAIMRLAFERILAEAELRRDPLDPLVDDALRRFVQDVTARSQLKRGQVPEGLDDKWLFSRADIEKAAEAAGFVSAVYSPNNDHATLYRDLTRVHLRLTTGRQDLTMPDWAWTILDGFDAALSLQAKRELMVEGAFVLQKGGKAASRNPLRLTKRLSRPS